jgi:hypothetical protein
MILCSNKIALTQKHHERVMEIIKQDAYEIVMKITSAWGKGTKFIGDLGHMKEEQGAMRTRLRGEKKGIEELKTG